MQPTAASPRSGDSAKSWFPNQARSRALLGWVLVILTAWTFYPALHNEFVNFDDADYVFANPYVKTGLTLHNIRWALTSTDASNWHPLTWISHMLDAQLYGLNPWGHHLSALVIHCANALLVFLVFTRMTGGMWRSFLLALIFAVHPLRVESVAWVSERKDVLSLLFWLLTMWCYCDYVQAVKIQSPQAKKYYALALLCFTLGLLSKPSVVTLPFVLLLLDYWPFKRTGFVKLLIEKIPFIALSAASCVMTFFAQKNGGAVSTLGEISLSARVENVFVAYVRYLGKIFWPTNLSVLYPLPDHISGALAIGSALLLIAISAGVLAMREPRRFLPVGWCWFLGTLVPMIGLVQVGNQAIADRYTYISGIGVLVMLIWSIPEISRRVPQRVFAVAVITIVALLCNLTREQIGYWQNSEKLFRHTLATGGDSWGARVNLGNAMLNEGRKDEAIEQFRIAVKLKPNFPATHDRLGAGLRATGRLDEALEQFEEILKINPKAATAQNEIGAILFDQGHLDEAISHYRASIALDPDAADARYNLGIALCYQNNYAEAAEQLQKAAALKPSNPRAHYNLGIALFHTGHVNEAIREYITTLVLEPGVAKTHFRLGQALAQVGRRDEAIAEFRAALALQLNYPEAAQELQKLTATP